MIRRFALHIAACFLVSFPARAKEIDHVRVTFDVLFWAEWPEQNLSYRSADKEKSIPLQNGLSGGLYKYEGPPSLVFYRDIKAEPTTGDNLPVPLAAIRFPKSTGHYILLFRHKGDNSGQYQIFPIPVTLNTFPLETVLAVNFSGSELQMQVQGMQGSLAPRGSRFFEVKADDFPIQMASRQQDEWQLVYSTVHSLQKNQRLLVVIHDQAGSDPGVAAFPIQEPASAEESYVDKDYKPDEMPEWMKTGVFR